MKLDELKKNWDLLGRIDPLWAILTDPRRKDHGWRPEEFFATGEAEIAEAMRGLERLGRPPARRRCLDFGCGAGRLTQALAERFDLCDGVDIAPSMIEAARALNRHGSRCVFHVIDTDDLGLFEDGAFDLVYSNIVLQHIPPEATRSYLREFLRVLAPDGLALFQLPSENIRGELVARHRLPDDAFRARITARLPDEVASGAGVAVETEVENASGRPWPADPPTGGTCRIRLGNHWLRPGGGLVMLDDGRVALPRDLGPGERTRVVLTVTAPARPGRYRLELDLVQEGVAWFGSRGSPTLSGEVRVRGGLVERWRARTRRRKATRPPDADDRLTVVAADAAPVMRMYAIPRDEVVAFLQASGGLLLEVRPDSSSGPEWRAFRYAVARVC